LDCIFSHGPKRKCIYINLSRFVKRIHPSSGFGQFQPAAPPLQEHLPEWSVVGAFKSGILLDKAERIRPGLAQNAPVTYDAGDSEVRKTGLPRPHEFTGTPDGQILFGDPEAIVGLFHDPETFARILRTDFLRHQDAEGWNVAPPDPSPQLVELRKTKTFRMFDDHQRGLGDVNSDLDDRG
jgi:hypothetical protein